MQQARRPGSDDGTGPRGEPDGWLRGDSECFHGEAADTVCDEAQRALTDADRAGDDAATALQELCERIEVAEQGEHKARRGPGRRSTGRPPTVQSARRSAGA